MMFLMLLMLLLLHVFELSILSAPLSLSCNISLSFVLQVLTTLLYVARVTMAYGLRPPTIVKYEMEIEALEKGEDVGSEAAEVCVHSGGHVSHRKYSVFTRP